MNPKIKDILGIAGIIAILIAAGAAVGYVKYYGKSIEPSSFRSFSVTGEGKAVAIPDIAEFTFSVITEGNKKLPDLQKENTEKTNKIIEFLKQQGIEPKDIKTVNYYVNPRYQYFNCPPVIYERSSDQQILPPEPRPCPPPEINGYTINQTVSVKIRNFDKTGEILSGTVERGANSVSQLTFTIDDRTKVEQEARAEALRKAREKAEATARAGGFRLGRLLSIDDSYGPVPYYDQYGRFESGGGGALPEKALPPTSIEPGSQEVVVNLVLRYEIQ